MTTSTTTRPKLDRQQLTDTLTQAVKWGRDIMRTGYRDPDWHVLIAVYTTGSVRAKLHFGQVDTNPRPSKVFGDIDDAEVIEWVSIYDRRGPVNNVVRDAIWLIAQYADVE